MVNKFLETYQPWQDIIHNTDVISKYLGLVNEISEESDKLKGILSRLVHEESLTSRGFSLHEMIEVSTGDHKTAQQFEYELYYNFAKEKGYSIPKEAFALVNPLIEIIGGVIKRVDSNFLQKSYRKSHPDNKDLVTEGHLESAMKVFEIGGYEYRNKDSLLKKAKNCLTQQVFPFKY